MPNPVRVASLTALAMLAFAGNSLLCRVALRDTAIDAATFTSIRLASGALVLAAIMVGRRSHPLAAGTWRAAAMLFAYAAFFFFAYRQLSAATGERLRALQLLGLLVALAGLVGLLLPGLAAPPIEGAVFMLGAGIAWGVYSLLGRGVQDPSGATAGNFLRALPFAAILSLATTAHASVDEAGVAYAVLSGAIASGLGYVLWYAALPALRAASAATIQLSVPVLAALGGVVLLAEPITTRLLISSAAILGASRW